MKQSITLAGSPLRFTLQAEGSERTLSFDSSQSGCPVPLQSAQAALAWLTEKRVDRVVMINHTEPMRLLSHLPPSIGFSVQPLADGRFQIEFFQKSDKK